MAKIAVIIPAHTHSSVVKLTIGSLLRTVGKNHDLNIHVGLHSNYSDYTKDLTIFDDLRGIAQIHLVDEIDWIGKYNTCIFRYSIMHAKNLMNLMQHIKHYSFDYLLILDHDLMINSDFVSKHLNMFPDSDMIGSLFEDNDNLREVITVMDNERQLHIPKASVWHLLLSKHMFDTIMKMPSDLIYPKEARTDDDKRQYRAIYNIDHRPIYVDTFADVLFRARYRWLFPVSIVPTADIDIKHFYLTSFNYGERTTPEKYKDNINNITAIYNSEFPNGLAEYRK